MESRRKYSMGFDIDVWNRLEQALQKNDVRARGIFINEAVDEKLDRLEGKTCQVTTQPPSELSLAYIAGLFDGEGCVSTQSGGYLSVSISNSHREVLEKLQHDFGGSLLNRTSNSGGNVWNWKVSTSEGEHFLRSMLPYLVIKFDVATAGIELSELSRFRYSKDHPEKVAARRKIHELNLRTSPRAAQKGEFHKMVDKGELQ